MLEISLLRQERRVQVLVNAAESHAFHPLDLALSEQDVKEFHDDPSIYGRRLYAALFPTGSAAHQALAALPDASRLILRMDDAALSSLPWEYAHTGSDWLATRFALLRARLENVPIRLPAAGRMRLLFVAADPPMHGGTPAPYYLGEDVEWEKLCEALQKTDPACDLIRVLPPTLDALHQELADRGHAIIHFTGHGALEDGKIALVFERPSGDSDVIPGKKFCERVQGNAGLVVLSACLSAAPGKGNEAGITASLAGLGVPFVLGFQLKVPDETARKFTTIFYRYLFGGKDVPEAVRQARLALDDDPLAQGMAVLCAAIPAESGSLALGEKGLKVNEHKVAVDLAGVTASSSGFVGRQRELVEIGVHLTPDRPRQGSAYEPLTVTLLGVGGIGKTALLHRAAQRFAWAFPHGVLGIALEPLPSPGDVFRRMETFFNLDDGSALNAEARGQNIAEKLTGRRALLALDNYETLLHARDGKDAAKKIDAFLLHRFFESLPARGPTLIVSSRQRTDLPREQTIPVGDLTDDAGAKLFRTRVTRRKAELEDAILFQINRKVGGHPLALLMLASRFDRDEAPSLQAFVKRVGDLLPEAASEWNEGRRHDTLQACFDFSLQALAGKDAPLRKELARLSLFCGDFLALFARVVLFDPAEGEEQQTEQMRRADRDLRALQERSLLEQETLRLDENNDLTFYHLHPTLRPFAGKLLKGKDRQAAQEAYWQALSNLAANAYPRIEGERWVGLQSDPLLALVAHRSLSDLKQAAEMRNDAAGSLFCYRTAFCLTQFGDLDGAMRLYEQSLKIKESLGDQKGKSATLHEMAGIFVTRGDLDGAMRLYEQSLKIDESLGDQKGKSATLHAMAGIFVTRGDLDGAMRLYEQSLKIKESLGDQKGKSATLHEMAGIFVTRGDLDGAMRLYEQSLKIDESLGDQKGKSATLHAMAGIFVTRGDLDGAMRLYEQSLKIDESLGDQKGKSATLHAMAGIFVTRGDLDGAMRLYEQSLKIDESLGDQKGKSATLHAMAGIFVTRGDLDGAMRLYEQSLKIHESLGDQKGKSATLHEMAGIFVTRGDLDGAMRLYEQSLKIKESLGDQKGKSATLHAMAGIFVTRGDLDGAMRLYEQSLKIHESLGDQQGKSATLHEMAYILRVRGDLDGAMRLYEQSLKIKESLGDQQGKAMTLGMLAQAYWAKKQPQEALPRLLAGLSLLSNLKIEPQTQQAMAQTLAGWREEMGTEQFDQLWKEITGAPVPDWLAAAAEVEKQGEEQEMSPEQWVTITVQAARRRDPQCEQLFKLAQQVASDPAAPAHLQALASVLQLILLGNFDPDLSALPPALAEMVRKALDGSG